MTKKQPKAKDQFQAKQNDIVDLIESNIELFRDKAAKACSDFSKIERKLLKKLTNKSVDSKTLLDEWANDIVTLNHKLDAKLEDDTLKSCLSKNLFLSKSGTHAKTIQIVNERKTEVLNDFILKHYPIDKKSKKDLYKKQRRLAKLLLSRPEEEIAELRQHQLEFMAYMSAAEERNITVVDPCLSKSNRKKAIQKVESEQRQVLINENDRLYEIKNKLNSLSVMSGGVLVDILDKNWDLNAVLALREKYEKAINKLPKKDANNAVRRLEIFDKETRDFRNEQTAKLVIDAEQISLATARTITKDIDNILLRLFDLTTTQKDQLIKNANEYGELVKEQAAIIEKQNSRSLKN